MASFLLTDVAKDVWVETFTLGPTDFGRSPDPAWSVTKAVLRGGRRDGVDRIHLDNGTLSLAIIPTRGMGIWKGRYQGLELGWASPVTDGPVHPSLVRLDERGGIGWLDGFDELMVRCGLANNGAPYQETTLGPDGVPTRTVIHGLHGRVANLPAQLVAVHVEDAPPHTITIEGRVLESTLFHTQVELISRLTTIPGSNQFTVVDEVHNRSDRPSEFQLLYHWNFGPPFLGPGSRSLLPVAELAPRNARAVEGIDTWNTYGGPEPGFVEQIYFARLIGEGPDGRTLAVLRDREGEKGVALRFATSELPCFTLWKNTGGIRDGYVTGLEPGTNFPNPKPFEAERGRVIRLAPGASHRAETTVEVLHTAESVATFEAEVSRIQASGAARIYAGPVEPYAAG